MEVGLSFYHPMLYLPKWGDVKQNFQITPAIEGDGLEINNLYNKHDVS